MSATVTVAARFRLNVTRACCRAFGANELRDHATDRIVRSTVTARSRIVRLPARSSPATRNVYLPSATVVPTLLRPFHDHEPLVAVVNVQRRTVALCESNRRADPVIASSAVIESVVASACPSPLG